MLLVTRIFGVLYLSAGIAKLFPQIENIHDVLNKAAIANKGTVLEIASDWLASHSTFVVIIVSIALITSGLCYLLNRLLIPAAIGQIIMLLCFMTFLHRLHIEIFIIDAPFIIVAIYILKDTIAKRTMTVLSVKTETE